MGERRQLNYVVGIDVRLAVKRMTRNVHSSQKEQEDVPNNASAATAEHSGPKKASEGAPGKQGSLPQRVKALEQLVSKQP